MKLVYERDYPKPGEKWKHFKGHVYEIICIAGDMEREGLDVVYRDTDDVDDEEDEIIEDNETIEGLADDLADLLLRTFREKE